MRSINFSAKIQMRLIIIKVSGVHTYIHKTDSRLRVRSDFIKENTVKVEKLIGQLENIDAIQKVKHQKHAGSVAIKFDSKQLDTNSLMDILESHSWTQSNDKPSLVEKAMTSGTKTLIKGVATIALNRVLGPTMSRLVTNLA